MMLIVINPKVRTILFSQFCPISLLSVIYKDISKVLANRLKQVLPEIIYEQHRPLCRINLLLTVSLRPMSV